MSSTSTNGQSAADILGLGPIDVYFPCEECDHDYEKHAPGCTEKDAIASWKPNPAYKKDGSTPGMPQLLPELKPCVCDGFKGALRDGKPKAIRMRMLSNFEWSSLVPKATLPMHLSGETETRPRDPIEDAKVDREAVKLAVTHIRIGGDPEWHRVRIVDEPSDDPWELTVDDLDRGGGRVVEELVRRLRWEYNYGGPFGGVVRSFRKGGARDVPPTRASVWALAARAILANSGRSGETDPSGAS